MYDKIYGVVVTRYVVEQLDFLHGLHLISHTTDFMI